MSLHDVLVLCATAVPMIALCVGILVVLKKYA